MGPLPPSLSDRGNARLFAELHRECFRHVEGLGWLSWDGHRWRREGGKKAAMWAAGEMAERMPDTDPDGVFSHRRIAHHKRSTLSTAGMKALLAQAKAAPELAVPLVADQPGAVVVPQKSISRTLPVFQPPPVETGHVSFMSTLKTSAGFTCSAREPSCTKHVFGGCTDTYIPRLPGPGRRRLC